MPSFYFFLLFLIVFRFNKNVYGVGKIKRPHINVYYKDFSEHLPSDKKDKLMKLLLESEDDEESDHSIQDINLEKLKENENILEVLMKEQANLSKKIHEQLKGYKKKNRIVSIKYTHDEEISNLENKENDNEDEEKKNVDTEIEVPMNLIQSPVVKIETPSLNIYEQIKMQQNIANLIDLNNEELYY